VTKSILSIGEILIDLIATDGSPSLETTEHFIARAGGAPANVAVAAVRQGVPSAFCGVCGGDPFGRKLRSLLRENAVEDEALRFDDREKTSLAFAWKDERGDGHFQLLRLADRLLDLPDIEAARIPERAAIVIGSVSLSEEPSRSAIHHASELAVAAGVPVCLDLNVRPSLWASGDDLRAALAPLWAKTTLLKLSLDDARTLHGADVEPKVVFAGAFGFGAKHVVLTDGARGCWFPDANGKPVHLPAFTVEPIEPTGAGDAFTAGILGRLIATNWSGITREDAEFASAAGAITAMRHGAIESLPSRDEIERFLSVQRATPTVS
jgi:fructokinase